VGTRYPLEAARTLRDAERERAESALAAVLEELRQAAARRVRAQERLAAFRREREERAASGDEHASSCTAAELRRAALFLERLRREEHRLAAAYERANEEWARAQDAVERARRRVAEAAARSEIVERHRERWQNDAVRAVERAADDELEDVHGMRSPR
jgi:hypothetical protein